MDRPVGHVPLTPFGARVTLDLRVAPSPAEAAELRELLAEHQLLVVPDQDITEEQLAAFARSFGNVLQAYRQSRDVGYLSNARGDGALGEAELVFHSDYAFTPDPLQAICLHAIDVRDTTTSFASSRGAYERLTPELRLRVEPLSARHEFDLAAAIESPAVAGARVARTGPHDQWTDHPLFVPGRHPALYLSYQHMTRIVGIPREESDALVDALFAAAFAPDNVYTHEWRVGDVVVWDNRLLQHARGPLAPGVPRTLRRVTVGDRDLDLVPAVGG